jgi:hypothetical protein
MVSYAKSIGRYSTNPCRRDAVNSIPFWNDIDNGVAAIEAQRRALTGSDRLCHKAA